MVKGGSLQILRCIDKNQTRFALRCFSNRKRRLKSFGEKTYLDDEDAGRNHMAQESPRYVSKYIGDKMLSGGTGQCKITIAVKVNS